MSTEIKYSFSECKNCIFANSVVNQELHKTVSGKNAKKEAIQLTCWVNRDQKNGYIGGIVIGSYIAQSEGPWKGKKQIVADKIGISAGPAPDFCPQLKKKE